MDRDELVERLHEFADLLIASDGLTPPVTVGMMGFPNVGKSSSVNKLMERKKVVIFEN